MDGYRRAALWPAIALVLFMGCESAPSPARSGAERVATAPAERSLPAAPAAEVQAVTIGYPAPSISWFPALVAERKGFFAEEQVSPTFVQMLPANIVAGLLSGEVDFGVDLTATSQAAVQQGAPLRALLAFSVRPQHRLMVRPEVRTFADLRGRVVAVNQRQDLTEWETRVVLERNGVAPEEVNLLAIPSSPSRLAALDSGQIAGAIMAVPFDLQAEAKGYHELGRIAREIDIAWVGLAAAQRLLTERPALVQRVLRASLRGLEYVRSQPEEAVALLQAWLSLDLEVARAAYALGLETWSVDGTASEEAWFNTLEVSRLAGPLPASVQLEQFVARAPLEAARQARHP
jgi:ABC-type nitrate/sulfonate/bicarbonate transport system substrate-binding protein